MKLKGEYRVVLNAGTPEEKDHGWVPNLVLDNGLNYLGTTGTGFAQYCHVGTNATAPAISQVSMLGYIASQSKTSSSAVNLGTATYAARYDVTYTFDVGGVIGTIAELGVGWSATHTNNLFSRALVVNGVGSPTTISVTATDQLTVYYRCTLTPSITDSTYTTLISGVSYTTVARLSSASSFFGYSAGWDSDFWGKFVGGTFYQSTSTLGAITSNPSGSNVPVSPTSINYAAYVPGNFYRDVTFTVLPAVGNAAGGIGAMQAVFQNSGWAYFQYSFSPAIPKDNTKTLTLTLRYSWGR